MSMLLDYWPIILGALGTLFGLFKGGQAKQAKIDASVAEANEKAERERRKSEKGQYEAVIEGNKKAEKIMEEAHDENSISDLTNDTY